MYSSLCLRNGKIRSPLNRGPLNRGLTVVYTVVFVTKVLTLAAFLQICYYCCDAEVKSSRTHFEVLGLGLVGQVLGQILKNWPVLGSTTAVFFELLKFCVSLEKFFGKRFFVEIAGKIFVKTFFFFGDRLKNFCEDLFFWSALALVSLVLGLGLEHSCP